LLTSIAVLVWACATPLKTFDGLEAFDLQALGHALARWIGVFIVIVGAWSAYFFAT